MKCSFLVSAFDRPNHLACLLRALQVQTQPDFEVMVADNSPGGVMGRVVKDIRDDRFQHIRTGMGNCYESANWLASYATGDYFCFPNDDNYYVPLFLELMLAPDVDLTYCDMVYDPRGGTEYRAVTVEPVMNLIDKGGFLIRRKKFQPFPWQESLIYADGMLIERLVAEGVSHKKVPGILWVHN
jgi:glycosyltransferase involved in cell wall biosynthesis